MNIEQLGHFLNRLDASQKDKQWSEGLGLLSPQKRVDYFVEKALNTYEALVDNGMSDNEAADKALGLDGKFRGQRGDISQEGVTAPKPTLSDLT